MTRIWLLLTVDVYLQIYKILVLRPFNVGYMWTECAVISPHVGPTEMILV